MPPSADEAGQQESLLNLDPVFQEGSGTTRKKSPKGKKKKRKDESPAEEDVAKAGKGGDAMEVGLDKKVYVYRHPDVFWPVQRRLADTDVLGHNLLQASSRSSTRLKPSSRLLQK